MITWAGINSETLGLTVERYPGRPRPTKKYSVVSIPGRNGDLYVDTGAYTNYTNYTQYYDIGIRGKAEGLPAAAQSVADWLYSPAGYQRLEDSYEPDVFRMAYFAGPLDVENMLNVLGRASIEFNCKPQRFLKSGEAAVSVASGDSIYNPTAFAALPIINIYGSGAGRLQVGEYVVEIFSLDGSMSLDSDLQNAYSGTANLNSAISAPEFPQLIAGNNEITYTGTWTVEIIPRWWTI